MTTVGTVEKRGIFEINVSARSNVRNVPMLAYHGEIVTTVGTVQKRDILRIDVTAL